MRTKLVTAAAVLLASFTGASTAWAHCGVMHDAPAGAEAVLLHVSTGRGPFSPPGSEVTIRDGHRHEHLSIYALVFGGAGYGPSDLGLTREQAAARGKLADFVDRLDDPKTYERAQGDTIKHPTGAHDVVLHTETSNNFWGGSYADAAAFTLYGDGRLVRADGSTRQLTEAEMQQLLADARHVGLLGHRSYGNALVTDQGTTTIDVHAGGVDRTLDIYALELVEGDHGLPRDQRHDRRALRAFLHGI